MIDKIKKTIFWTAIVYIALIFFTLTIAQILPYEFANYKIKSNFYDFIIYGVPVAILLTLIWTIQRENRKIINWSFLTVTVLTSIMSFYTIVFLISIFGFGSWITVSTIYRHKTKDKVIKEQFFDVGALGYGGQRIVEIKPVLKYWILPTEIDTLKINKNEWKLVNEQGDIKFP